MLTTCISPFICACQHVTVVVRRLLPQHNVLFFSCKTSKTFRTTIEMKYELLSFGLCSINIYTVRAGCFEEFCPVKWFFTHADPSLQPHPANRICRVYCGNCSITLKHKKAKKNKNHQRPLAILLQRLWFTPLFVFKVRRFRGGKKNPFHRNCQMNV